MTIHFSILAWEFHEQSYCPWGHKESDTTEQLTLSLFFFSWLLLILIGEGNGNPLQCSCLENPRDRGAWWAAIYGVTQSRTRLKRLSSTNTYKDVLQAASLQHSATKHASRKTEIWQQTVTFWSPWNALLGFVYKDRHRLLLFSEVHSSFSLYFFTRGNFVFLPMMLPEWFRFKENEAL